MQNELTQVQRIAAGYSSEFSSFIEKNSGWSERLTDHSIVNYIVDSLNTANKLANTENPLAQTALKDELVNLLEKIMEYSKTYLGNKGSEPQLLEFFLNISERTRRDLVYLVETEIPNEITSEQIKTQQPLTSKENLKMRSRGERVSQLQMALKQLGLFSSVADGIFGPATISAVKSFQVNNNLELTDEVDEELFDMIINASTGTVTQKEAQQFTSGESKTVEHNYQPFYLSEGNHRATADQLEFENDIESLASVIMLKEVKPPLAIGLFGNWGSGKSFFMEKLGEKIQFLTRAKSDTYVKEVVQVKFNSWHYSDANLWASLVTEIFDSLRSFSKKENKEDELKKLTETLQITSVQKEAVEKRHDELQKKISALENEKQKKRDRLEDLSGFKLLKLILSDEKIKSDIGSLKNENIEKILGEKDNVVTLIKTIEEHKNDFFHYLKLLKSLKGWNWIFVFVVMILIFAFYYIVQTYFVQEWEILTLWGAGLISVVTPILTKVLNVVIQARLKMGEALTRLQSIRQTLDSREEYGNAELDENINEVNELKDSLDNINEKIKTTQNELSDIRSGKKLFEFIEQRSGDDSYAKQLGLVSWIRKDFNRLDDLLRKQHELNDTEKSLIENPEDVKLKIDRIILYIDDLDRCHEDIVVKVLEAIHLLLAFPLFVVVVGVDPRWLNNALSEKFKTLLGKSSHTGSEWKNSLINKTQAGTVATTYDYLEKIFQIPFTLKPINKTGREKLLTYLIRNEMEQNENIGSTFTTQNQTITSINETDRLHQGTGEEKIILPERLKLTFQKKELEFIKKLSPLFGTSPRSINRFMNIYRIIKSHKSLKVTDRFSEDEYEPIIFLLSIIVGFSGIAQNIVERLFYAEVQKTLRDFIDSLVLPFELKEKLSAIGDDQLFDSTLEPYKRNLELVSRFSFRTISTEYE